MSSKSKQRPIDKVAPIHKFKVTGMGFSAGTLPEGYATGRIDIYLPEVGWVLAMSDTLAAQLRDDLTTNLEDLDAMRKFDLPAAEGDSTL